MGIRRLLLISCDAEVVGLTRSEEAVLMVVRRERCLGIGQQARLHSFCLELLVDVVVLTNGLWEIEHRCCFVIGSDRILLACPRPQVPLTVKVPIFIPMIIFRRGFQVVRGRPHR